MLKPTDAVILIPSLHPDDKLEAYVEDLSLHGFHRMVVVDDGSGEQYRDIFERLKSRSDCLILGYENNRGKGYALKHGMQAIQKHYPDCLGVITADSDGQHTAEDCIKVAQALIDQPDKLALGTRDFSQANVPPKSRTGNRLTSFFFALLYGHWLPDTQTGLRGIGMALLPRMLQIPGDRFEYEMNMLIHCSGWNVGFLQVPIDTIYLDSNAGTHFRPLHDSARIYKLLFGNFFRFASSGALSTLLDIALFTALDKWLIPAIFPGFAYRREFGLVLAATAIARVCSALFNYRINQQYVFKFDKVKGSLLRYASLVVLVLLSSAFLVFTFNQLLGMDKTLAKVLVDSSLFFVNYRVQRAWVFARPQERKPRS